MEPAITSGKQLAKCADLAESEFRNVNLGGAVFDDVNLSGATFHNINFSDISISAAQMGGARFKHIGLPPNADRSHGNQRGVTFEEMHLNDSTFRDVDLTNVRIEDCKLDGMTIDGIPVTEMIAAYRKQG